MREPERPMRTRYFRMSPADDDNLRAIAQALAIRSESEAPRFALQQTRPQLVGKKEGWTYRLRDQVI